MRIALVTYSTKPRRGVVHTLPLAEALARRGESVTVYALGRGGDTAFFRPVDASLPALVAGAAVFAFPSVQEGFGLAALEAAAAGVPLVIRDLPVLRQVLGAAATYVATPADLVGAGRAPDPGAVAAGRRAAASFSWDAAAAHQRLYAAVSGWRRAEPGM